VTDRPDFSFEISDTQMADLRQGRTLYASMAPNMDLPTYMEETPPYHECLPLDYIAIRGNDVWACTGRRSQYPSDTGLSDETISFAYTNTGPIYSLIYYALPKQTLVAGTVTVKVLPLLMYGSFAFQTGAAVETLWNSETNDAADTGALKDAVRRGVRLSILAELPDGLQLRLPVNIPYLHTESEGFDLRTMAEILPGFFEHPANLIDTLKQAHPDILSTEEMASRSLGLNASCLFTFFEFNASGSFRSLIEPKTAKPTPYRRLTVFGSH